MQWLKSLDVFLNNERNKFNYSVTKAESPQELVLRVISVSIVWGVVFRMLSLKYMLGISLKLNKNLDYIPSSRHERVEN